MFSEFGMVTLRRSVWRKPPVARSRDDPRHSRCLLSPNEYLVTPRIGGAGRPVQDVSEIAKPGIPSFFAPGETSLKHLALRRRTGIKMKFATIMCNTSTLNAKC